MKYQEMNGSGLFMTAPALHLTILTWLFWFHHQVDDQSNPGKEYTQNHPGCDRTIFLFRHIDVKDQTHNPYDNTYN